MVAAHAQSGRLTARREVLGMAGTFAMAAVAPGPAAAQRYTATSISQAAQQARRDVGALARRADDLLRVTVADGPEHNAVAVRRFRTEQMALARELAAVLNSRVSEDDWLLIVPTSELDLVLAMRPLAICIAPSTEAVEAAIKQPLPQIEPLAGDEASDVLLTIVLDALGLARRIALFEQLRNDRSLGPALAAAADAGKARRYGLAALELERAMWAIVEPATVATIADNLGPDSPRRLYQALIVRFMPFIGWSYFVSLLLATIYYNGDTSAPILR